GVRAQRTAATESRRSGPSRPPRAQMRAQKRIFGSVRARAAQPGAPGESSVLVIGLRTPVEACSIPRGGSPGTDPRRSRKSCFCYRGYASLTDSAPLQHAGLVVGGRALDAEVVGPRLLALQ